jgi:hypothetical protein
MTAFPFTVFRIHLVKGERRDVESEFTDLDSAVEHVKWLMRHEPGRRVTLDVIPPVGAVPAPPAPAPADDFEERLLEALRTPLGTPAQQAATSLRVEQAISEMSGDLHQPKAPYRYPGQPRALSEMELHLSWERERGHTGEPNPFETLVQKRSQQHVDAVEKAAEQALQGGEYGVRVDVYPFRTEARVDPTVPYGHSVEHQHMTDPQETWRPTA